MRRGFTLIELMVVIAIISILASILFPVFSKAREKARATACLANINQLGTATMMYRQDYDDTFPLSWCVNYDGTWNHTWRGAIEPYVSNYDIYTCPSAPDLAYDLNPYNGADMCGYAINNTYTGWGDNFDPPAGAREAAVASPSTTILYLDFNGWFEVTWQYYAPDLLQVLPKRHNGALNICFCDTHCKLMRPEQIETDETGSRYLHNYWTIERD